MVDMFQNVVPRKPEMLNYHLMELQFFEKTQTPIYIFISQVLHLGYIVLPELEALLLNKSFSI